MLLIITHKTDFTADFIINKLNQKKIKYRRFNCEDILKFNCSLMFENSFSYTILDQKEITSVWYRRTQLPDLSELPVNERIYILNEVDSLMKNLYAVIDANWVSDPFYINKAENKLYQLKVAQKIGFQIPPTLITNSKEKLESFYYENKKQIIVKPLSMTKIENKEAPSFIFTNIITQSQINNLSNFDLTPCIYQKRIEKKYEIRVTVIGSKVFAASVDSQSDAETQIDWRKKRLQFKKIKLPQKIETQCIKIVEALNLDFGAIDLIKNLDNTYTFLEINPNGQWVWIEKQTGLKISNALLNKLLQNEKVSL